MRSLLGCGDDCSRLRTPPQVWTPAALPFFSSVGWISNPSYKLAGRIGNPSHGRTPTRSRVGGHRGHRCLLPRLLLQFHLFEEPLALPVTAEEPQPRHDRG